MSASLRRQLSSPNALFAFEATARLRSFRQAATELNVTQPSISYQIRNLEKHLDTKLFRRIGRSIELTQDGEILFQAVSSGLLTIQEGLARMSKRQSTRLVTICVSAPFASFFLMPRLPRFREAHPQIDLNLKIVSRDLNPIAENADFAVVMGDGQWQEFDAWPLYEEVVFPLCSPQYVSGQTLPIPAEELRQLELLHLDERFRDRMTWESFFQAATNDPVELERHLIFSDQQPLLEAAVNGHGIALGWLGTTDDLVKKGALIRPSELIVKTDKSQYLIAPKNVELSRSARKFFEWILAEASKVEDLGASLTPIESV